MTYQPHVLGVGMSVFDQLPRQIRDKLNDGVVTQTARDMDVVYRLWRRYGTKHVLRVLEDAAKERLAERR